MNCNNGIWRKLMQTVCVCVCVCSPTAERWMEEEDDSYRSVCQRGFTVKQVRHIRTLIHTT